ncbi:hypothetical protein GCM10009718_34950 [Isoptericola halotolerans]|uniref:DUF4386 family protein n=1 Tax=Isoptericola halotolerans TaxID=300560 RepID=A0ABX2A325_9MICO|nr:hypothetical protein [Isoptericola halotolerans]NOV97140.1 hypothetical protein [Isoptericola halotolerans]
MTDRKVLAAQVQRRAVRRVTRSIATSVITIGAGFWLVYAVVAVVVPLLVRRAGNEMEHGVLATSDYIARWVAFGTAIAMLATILATHLAAGGTRRALRDGAIRAAVIAGVVYAAIGALATVGERGLFGALGWTWQRADALTTGDGAFAVELVADTFATAVYVLVGCAVVAGYQSHGGWRGTLLVVPGLVPLALVDLVTAGGSGHDVLGNLVQIPASSAVAIGLVGGAAAVVLAAGWLHLHLHSLRLRPTR